MSSRFCVSLLLLLLGSFGSRAQPAQPLANDRVHNIPALPSVPSQPVDPTLSRPAVGNSLVVPPPQQQPAGLEAAEAGIYIPPLPLRAEPPPNRRPQAAPPPPQPVVTFDNMNAPVITAAPLQLVVRTEWPALIDGQNTTIPIVRSLTIEAERVQALYEKGLSEQMAGDLKIFLDKLRQPKNTRFEPIGLGWGLIQGNGIKVDFAASKAALAKALNEKLAAPIVLPVIGQIAPQRKLAYFASKGITAHLGTGSTNYQGSSPERITNIHIGAKRFKERLVGDGVVSFNKIVGPISKRAGFVTGLVIAGDQTADGIGGGICQVSTTVFRTLYVAGLPLLERRPHSYQVFYYKPQGLDATIYQPSLDLKFRNNTGAPLWFQSDWDDEAANLTVHVFGKPRPYVVQIEGPKVLKETAPPPDRFVKDRKLAKGQRKQIDWAAKGAEIEVVRKLLKDGKVVAKDVLRSSYRPWPNIYLIGED